MRRIVEWIIAVTIGAGIVWWLTRPRLESHEKRLESHEQRLLALENRIATVESRILEFQSTYHEDKADILYQYSLLKREIEQLKQRAIPPDRKRELDTWLDFLAQIKDQKIREKEKVQVRPVIYLA